MKKADAWGMSFKIGEEMPGGDKQGGKDIWEGECENGLHEGHNGGLGYS